MAAGVVLVAAVFLPWVNSDVPGWVTTASADGGAEPALQTRWGWPALGLALAVIATGAVMLRTRPRRRSWLLGVLVAALGVAVFAVAQDAAANIGFLDPGVGMFLTTLAAVLLVPIGLAAALVARFVARAEEREAAASSTAGRPRDTEVEP